MRRRGEVPSKYSTLEKVIGVIARESGRSSIPETLVINLDASGILDAPPPRGMTAERM